MKQETLDKLNALDWSAPADGKHEINFFVNTVSEHLNAEDGSEIAMKIGKNFQGDEIGNQSAALKDVHGIVGECTGILYQPSRKDALIAYIAFKYGCLFATLEEKHKFIKAILGTGIEQ